MKTVLLALMLITAITFGQSSAHAGAFYTSCINENRTNKIQGVWEWSIEYTYYIEVVGVSLVRYEDGSVARGKTALYNTRDYETSEEAYQDYRRALRSLVAQGVCPASALN